VWTFATHLGKDPLRLTIVIDIYMCCPQVKEQGEEQPVAIAPQPVAIARRAQQPQQQQAQRQQAQPVAQPGPARPEAQALTGGNVAESVHWLPIGCCSTELVGVRMQLVAM